MRRLALAFTLLFLLASSAFAQPRSVVMISIDGLKPDYILEADKYGLKIPNLRRLAREGSFARGVTGVLPTVTYPSHATMVTGVSPAKHGILYNLPFDPMNKNQGGWMWYAEDIKSPTLWEVVRKAGKVSSTVDWPVSVGAPATYNIAQFWRATTEDDHKLLRAVSTPGLLAKIESELGPYPAGYIYTVESDSKRARFNAWIIEHLRPAFHTGYFSVLDEVEHEHGPYTREVYETLEALDAMVGVVWSAAEKAYPGKYVFCIVSDHGFAPYTNSVSLNAAFREAGLISLDAKGAVKDWKAMTWGGGGSTAVMLKNPNDSATVEAVRAILERLRNDPANGILRVLTNQEAVASGGFPGASFVVGVKPGWVLSGGWDRVLTTGLRKAGTHGFLRDLSEMYSSFFVAGAGIARGRDLGQIDMRDIAPTLAKIIGVSLPSAEGRDVLSGRK